jgi:hypothetical protein
LAALPAVVTVLAADFSNLTVNFSMLEACFMAVSV